MNFELFIATRYLRAKRRQAFIGVITAISIIGVAAGVASLIVALAINNGFRQDLQARLLGSTSHVNLMRVEADGIKNWPDLLAHLEKTPHVVAAAPAIYEEVLISRGANANPGVLKGVLPDYENKVTDLLKTIKVGSIAPLQPKEAAPPPPTATSPDDLQGVQNRVNAMPPIILGKDMAEKLGDTEGSIVLVTSPQGELTPFGIVPKYMRFKVAGVFDSGFYDYDSNWAFTSLQSSQSLFGLGNVISV